MSLTPLAYSKTFRIAYHLFHLFVLSQYDLQPMKDLHQLSYYCPLPDALCVTTFPFWGSEYDCGASKE